MTVAVMTIVATITFTMLGFRFDTNNGNIERYAFMQFSSSPSGATISIDGNVINSRTPSKSSVHAGKHEIVMWRDGYETWRKSVDVKPGMLTWLNYSLLVPKKLPVIPVATYKTLFSTLASSKGNYMLVQEQSNVPSFNLVDLSSDKIKSTKISIPSNIYTKPISTSEKNEFQIDKWDNSEKYVLVSHIYGDKTEWLVLDTQNVSQTKNATKLFDLDINNVVFAGNNGNLLYVLNSGDIRKLDLSAGTISKPLVNNVIEYNYYNDSKVITYVGDGKPGSNEKSVGIYRDGDNKPSIIRTVKNNLNLPLRIATTNYFNENYVAISWGEKVDILSGSYPNTTSDITNSMKQIASFNSKNKVDMLSFSPTGKYVFTQSGSNFSSYDLEYQKLASSTIGGSGYALPIKWLDDNYIWSNRDGKLNIREFDGANVHTINSALANQDATLTNNGRYLYSINKSVNGFQLQRVRMMLP